MVSALGLLAFGCYANFQENYFIEVTIPGIVEGTATMFDSEAYFAKNALTTVSVEVDIECNNSNDLELYVGYKASTYELLDVSQPMKEVCLWSGADLHPTKSVNCLSVQQHSPVQTKLNMQWGLLGIGFSTDDYVQADERIWYLEIKHLGDGPYGYERNVTQEINGTLITLPEYFPHINILNKFELAFNDITFQTLLHPVFDSSCAVVVVIRGVNHELGTEDKATAAALGFRQQASSWSATGSTSSIHWVIVFATENYAAVSMVDSIWMVHAGYLFIFGEHPDCGTYYYRHPNGMYDYGFRIIYCMDGSESNLPTKTCTQTDDGFLEAMYDYADVMCDTTEDLIVFIQSHGSTQWGYHVTLTSSSINLLLGWTNAITANEHKAKISAITDDGTDVFLWLDSCHGNWMTSWSPSQHNNHLEVWCYAPYAYQMAWNIVNPPVYNKAYWQFDHGGQKACEAEWFFSFIEEPLLHDVTWMGEQIGPYFNETLHPGISSLYRGCFLRAPFVIFG